MWRVKGISCLNSGFLGQRVMNPLGAIDLDNLAPLTCFLLESTT